MLKIFGIVAAVVVTSGAANAQSLNRLLRHENVMNYYSGNNTNAYQSSPEGLDPSWRVYPMSTRRG